MKKINQVNLSDICLDMCPLTEDKEGKLCGGFVGIEGEALESVSKNTGCSNGTCTNPSCKNAKCDNSTCTNVKCAKVKKKHTCDSIERGLVSESNIICSDGMTALAEPVGTDLSAYLF